MDVLDDPAQWYQYVPPPSDVNQKRFNKRLQRITGHTASGEPAIRLVWGWSPEARIWYRGEWRVRYRFHTVNLPSGSMVDLAVPRWFLEELVEPAQYREQWEAMRWEVDGLQAIDLHGPAPERGWYVCAALVAEHEHDNACCIREWKANQRRCWGKYKAPGDQELELVQKAVRLREQAKQHNRPNEPMAVEALEECRKLNFEKKKSHDEDMGYHYQMVVRDFINCYGPIFASDDPTVHKWGKYHFTNAHNKSGLLVPKGLNGNATS